LKKKKGEEKQESKGLIQVLIDGRNETPKGKNNQKAKEAEKPLGGKSAGGSANT